jgi:ATP-dependent exoDNAse (exonuclease V) beta subunit
VTAQDIVDAVDREAARDPSRSFIVQAPAGSGKTGLLIQRFLRLLATVGQPEEILAITFTRKAAAEMRRRVLKALAGALDGAPPVSDNERVTWQLAREALARDREYCWKILENSARLKIQTIDALCISLAARMPILAGLGAPPTVVEDARDLYREAAERTLGLVQRRDPAAALVAELLVHLDNDWSSARKLLEQMLARRDQWMRRIVGLELGDEARQALESAFREERARLMASAHAHFPAGEESEIVALARFASENIASNRPDSPIAGLATLARLPAADESGAANWLALADFLLVAGAARTRKQVNKNQGFPPGDKGNAQVFKQRMESLLERIAVATQCGQSLDALRTMPPAAYTDRQWAVLGAVVALLPLAAAQLSLLFGERGQIDFPGVAQGAVRALGEESEPTDLMLALDVRLRHLLVDEFQDTSIGQWDLLTRLTAGWVPDDGRTVFLVGDPMQSIYRFREAEVALFLRAFGSGLPSVTLSPLRISTNFRSQRGIVDWVNRSFAQILPVEENANSGAVPYAPSAPHHPQLEGEAVAWHAFVGNDREAGRLAEANRVAELVAAEIAGGASRDVAILVRNRSHLDRIVPALKRANIRFRAVEIEPLGGRQVIQDLLAITRAISHEGDRVAWLALLRAPWCGLLLADLLALATPLPEREGSEADRSATIWALLGNESRLARLSPDGRARALRIRAALEERMANRLRGTLRARVEGVWLSLGGPACVERASDLEDAETFFDQLDELEESGDLADVAVIEEHLAELFAAPDLGTDGKVQVMTIHKAKGLEFGTVIVPGLDRQPRASDKPLFAWKVRADGRLMMAPVRAAGEATEPAYDYLCELDRAAGEHESERLLYVAATRAKDRLHLLGCARVETTEDARLVKAPAPRSLLAKAWQVAREKFEEAPELAEDARRAEPAGEKAMPDLRQLQPAILGVVVAPPALGAMLARASKGASIEFSWVGETARHVGTITHRWLQRIAVEGLEAWDASRVNALGPMVARELERRGVPPREHGRASDRVLQALGNALGDERGRWVLGAHAEATSEHRLRVAGPDGVRLLVIDRIFRDGEGQRWIVDYKSGGHEGADREAFLDQELQRYRAQLEAYVAALGASEAIRAGLYFPLMKAWREV